MDCKIFLSASASMVRLRAWCESILASITRSVTYLEITHLLLVYSNMQCIHTGVAVLTSIQFNIFILVAVFKQLLDDLRLPVLNAHVPDDCLHYLSIFRGFLFWTSFTIHDFVSQIPTELSNVPGQVLVLTVSWAARAGDATVWTNRFFVLFLFSLLLLRRERMKVKPYKIIYIID